MVDQWTGRWTYEKDTPEEKKCNLDYVADVITEMGYTPKHLSMEDLCLRIISEMEEYLETTESEGKSMMYDGNGMIIPDMIKTYLEMLGFKEFDQLD